MCATIKAMLFAVNSRIGLLDDTSMIYMLEPGSLEFPPSDQAMKDPDGLLAIGGDLSPDRLIEAYRQGIFPWFQQGQPILWWSPDPRWVIFPDDFHLSRSLRKVVNRREFSVTFDRSFEQVLTGCASPAPGREETWITDDMRCAYIQLFAMGLAHSVECWEQEQLVGGLYGIALGKVFFGESMFSRRTNASKVAMARLVEKLRQDGFRLIDCQVHTRHLESLGSTPISRTDFIKTLHELIPDSRGSAWS